MRKLFAAIALTGVALLTFQPAAQAHGNAHHKAWVCKYVGTPGVDERLKNGNDGLVWVDVEATEGTYFNDAQGRSYVLRYQSEHDPKPEASECPTSTTTTTADPSTTSTVVETTLPPTSTSVSTTTEPATTSTTEPETTTSAEPPTSTTQPEPSTTISEETTTSEAPTTTQPPVVTTVPPTTQPASTTTQPTHDTVPVTTAPSTSSSTVVPSSQPSPRPSVGLKQPLPFTGGRSNDLAAIGLALLYAGAFCLAMKQRHARR